MILATGVTMFLYTHRQVYDIFSNRGYEFVYTHRQVYDISATGVTMFCIRTDWCMILATGVTMFVYTQRQVYDISATGFTIFCIRTD